MKIAFDFLEKRLSNMFCRYAVTVTHWPLPFIVIPVVVALSMSFGFVWEFGIVKDDLDLYTPTDGLSKLASKELQKLFPLNDTDRFFAERRLDGKHKSGFIIVTPKEEGDDMMDDDRFREIAKVWRTLERFKINTEKYPQLVAYEDLCVRTSDRKCVKSFILQLYDHLKEFQVFRYVTYSLYTSSVNYQPLEMIPENHTAVAVLRRIFLANLIAVNMYEDIQKNFTTMALMLPYQLRYSNDTLNVLSEQWEKVLDEVLRKITTENISINWWTSETLTMETQKDTNVLLRLLMPMFLFVTTFTVGCCFVNDCLRSKPWLGLSGVISACLSVVSSMGILLLCGAKLTSVTYLVPFLTFSIGVDNVFILIAAWRKTNVFDSVEHRMQGSFEDAAVSITVTSLTDAVSFAVGCMSTYPSVRSFCLYACVAILFIYINQLTFFAGCMVVSGKREQGCRNCFTLRVMKEKQKMLKQKETIYHSHLHKPIDNEGIADHAAARFFKGPYATVLLHPATKTFVFVSLVIYLSVSLWAMKSIVIGVHPTDLLPQKSEFRRTLNLHSKYFYLYSDVLHVWFVDLGKYEQNVSFWLALDNDTKLFEFTKYSGKAESWLREFFAFVSEFHLDIGDETKFVENLQHVFLALPDNQIFARDVRIHNVSNDNRVYIEAARFTVRLCNVSVINQYGATHHFRQIAAKTQFDARVYNEFFEFGDQFDSIVPSLFGNMGIGSLAVVIASLLLIPKPLCSIWVCSTIVSINVGILGYMSLWDVHLDFISLVTIIMSIGASVDFSAHIAYHFAKTPYLTAERRIRDSLYVVGTPVVQSAFSTWLGVMMILIVDSYSFRSFVKTSTLVILFGLIHGLVVLPVFLTIFHPTDAIDVQNEMCNRDDNFAKVLSRIEKTLSMSPKGSEKSKSDGSGKGSDKNVNKNSSGKTSSTTASSSVKTSTKTSTGKSSTKTSTGKTIYSNKTNE